jgi:8-oxo-dGTP pyrophosphatase MutT (NUDIX family)
MPQFEILAPRANEAGFSRQTAIMTSTDPAANVSGGQPALTFNSELARYNVPLSGYLPSNPQAAGIPFDGFATGSLVIDPETSKILLVQRAAHDSMPLKWETPGGAVDAEDESILHAAARELLEETGLVATRIVELVGGMQEFVTRKGLKVGKMYFLVEVDVNHERHGNNEIKVRMDPNEHVQHVWASEEEARAKKVGDVVLEYTTDAQEEAIYEAYRIWNARGA